MGADNSMGTSLATMTTGAMNAHTSVPDSRGVTHPNPVTLWRPLVHHLPWLCTSPPGYVNPHWLTLSTTYSRSSSRCCLKGCCSWRKPYASLCDTHVTDVGDTGDGADCRSCCHKPRSVHTGEHEDGDEVTRVDSLKPTRLIRMLCCGIISLMLLTLVFGLINLLTISM